jgi:hypothetical protein
VVAIIEIGEISKHFDAQARKIGEMGLQPIACQGLDPHGHVLTCLIQF